MQVSDYRYLRLKTRPELATASRTVRAMDLYAGAGALSLGVWEACRTLGLGFKSVTALDIEKSALDVYCSNFQTPFPILGDIRSFVNGKIGSPMTKQERAFTAPLGKIDVLLSGSPCQGFSPLNHYTRGRDSRNGLYLRAARVTELVKPENVLFENVPDVLNGSRDVVGESKDLMTKLGYYSDELVVDLADIGIPQRRKRHILIGSRSKRVSVKEALKIGKVRRGRSVHWAIGDLERESEQDVFTTPSKLSVENMRRVNYLHQNDRYNLPNARRPLCHRKKHSYVSMYGRLRYDEVAQTVTSGFGSPGQGRFIHPALRRTLTPHEAARLQFFPDFFDFSCTSKRTDLANLIGNAAPMKLSYTCTLHFYS